MTRSIDRALLAIVLSLFTLIATATCSGVRPEPYAPLPALGGAPTGGTSSTGGNEATGGATAEGGTTAGTTVAVEFPACNPAAQRAKPVDRSKMKLGRKTSQIVKRPKASYTSLAGAKPVFWRSTVPWALSQADLGACTGFATVQARLTLPFSVETIPGRPATFDALNQLGRDIYSAATFIDPFLGHWPTEDTGSNGDSAMRIAVSRGLFKGYRSIDSLAGLQKALQSGPVILGIDWYEGFFSPSRCGEASKGKTSVVGGHEITGVGDDPDKKVIWLLTSWDNDFGVCLGTHCGYFYLTYGTVSDLFAAGAEAEQPS